ncbi:MAG: hypothetical protein GC191_09415 [Azospirillum sp.]|nr:hypothetical protein [Azospirillum sp.]
MPAVAFDTHETVKTLTRAGFTEPQAEAVIGAVRAAAAVDLSPLATKDDVNRAVRESELRLEARIEAAKADTLKWMFGAMGVQTLAILGALAGLLKLIGR